MKGLKEYWFLYLFSFSCIGGGSVWIATINSKTFDSTEQKVIHDYHVKNALTPEQQQKAYLLDSMNKTTAIEFRSKVTKTLDQVERSKKYQDSIALLNADQMFQIKQEIERIKAHQ